MKLFRINSIGSGIRAVLGWPLLVIGVFMGTALLGSLFPANADWREPESGVSLFVETNGVHVSIVVPITHNGHDLSDLIKPQDISDPDLYGTHVAIGWGHGGVYRNAETWSGVKLRDVASAVVGSDDTVLHVYHLTNPQPTRYRARFQVTEAQYRKIIEGVRATFALNAAGQSEAQPAYGADNVFYRAHGRYSAVNTCNEWTASILRKAGVKVGLWTPMPGGVMRWFPNRT
ncbi:MAG: TIGR02117 family protein [Sphingorhabdus sp.]